MPNDWFQFKQFRIHQGQCAMKVSTDACIQGAWAAATFSGVANAEAKILDIGTGTGLLTLMLAQAIPGSHFDAVEINEDAYRQAISNFEASDWSKQISAHHTSLADFANAARNEAAYDLIICNPPFFQNHLESAAKARNDARHSQSLSKEELAASVARLLKDGGMFCVMFPATEWDKWITVAHTNGLYASNQLHVKPTPASEVNRVIGIFSKKDKAKLQQTFFTIYNADKSYTTAMEYLLNGYYLAF